MPPKAAPTKAKEAAVSLAQELHVDTDLRRLADACSTLGPPLELFTKRVKVELTRVKEGEQNGLPQISLIVTEALSFDVTRQLFTAVLPSYPYLRKLLLSNSAIGDDGALVLQGFVKTYKPAPNQNPFGIEHLDLSGCGITGKGCVYLGKMLGENSSLKTLKLDFNKIGDEGMARLNDGLKWNSTVQELSMQYCGMTAEGANYLSYVIKSTNVKDLSLRGNPLGDEGVVLIGRALMVGTSIENIDLADTCFGEKAEATVTLAEGLEKSESILKADLDFNTISAAGAQSFLRAVENNSNIVSLVVGERVESATYTAILDALRNNIAGAKKKTAKKPSKKK